MWGWCWFVQSPWWITLYNNPQRIVSIVKQNRSTWPRHTAYTCTHVTGGGRQQRRNKLHMTFKYVVFKMQRLEWDATAIKCAAVHDLWMNKQLLTQKYSWAEGQGLVPVWMAIHVKGNHKITMFPLRFTVKPAYVQMQPGNMQSVKQGGKKRCS